MSEMTKEQAIAIFESEAWKKRSHRERASFQLHHELLCMPFDVFHESVEKALGRPVWTHEFGLNWNGLKAELAGSEDAPTMEEILALIPKDKLVVVLEEKSDANQS